MEGSEHDGSSQASAPVATLTAERSTNPPPPTGHATLRAWSIVGIVVLLAAAMSVVFVVGTRNQGVTSTSTASVVAAHPAVAAATNVNVILTEFKVASAETTIPAGQVTLHITNNGAIQHELLVFKSNLAPSQYPMADGGIAEDDPSIAKVSDGDNIDPGATQTRTVDLSTPGTYLFVCNIPGHFMAGMWQQITVQ